MENRRTPLYDFHIANGARMAPFAGWDMPVQYPAGTKPNIRLPNGAALFDVSHMAQIELAGDGADAVLERLTPTDLAAIKDGRVRYSMFLNETGGVLDDLMIARFEGALHLVVNAGRAMHDIAHMEANLTGANTQITVHDERALLALQGPGAAAILSDLGLDLSGFVFMDIRHFSLAGVDCAITRSGYTGEDGFEISLAGSAAQTIATLLAARDDVFLCGLGARDTLRMEAGLPLWGHELSEEINPLMAGLTLRCQNGGARQAIFQVPSRFCRIGIAGQRRRLLACCRSAADPFVMAPT